MIQTIGPSFVIAAAPSRRRRQYIERMLSHSIAGDNRSHAVRFQFDQSISASAFAARILWIMGFPDQALRIAEKSVAQAQALGHSLSLSLFCFGFVSLPTHAVSPLSECHRTQRGVANR